MLGGGVNTALTYGIYLALGAIIHYQIAYGIAYVAGVVFSFFFNTRLVFKTRMSLIKFLRYPLVYLVQYIFSALVLMLLVENGWLSEKVAPLLVVLASIPLTYILSKILLRDPEKNFNKQP